MINTDKITWFGEEWDINYQQKLGHNGYNKFQILNDEGLVMVEGDMEDGVIPEKEKLLIINLIAASPELINRLEDTQDFIHQILNYFNFATEDEEKINELLDKNQKVIDKAKGGNE